MGLAGLALGLGGGLDDDGIDKHGSVFLGYEFHLNLNLMYLDSGQSAGMDAQGFYICLPKDLVLVSRRNAVDD